ncbi:MAG: hypothetical protein WBW48_22250, partial [Anaerolineae bacterium]
MVIIATAVVFFVGSLVVLRLPTEWQLWASGAYLAFLAISAALSFWADVGGIRSSLRGEEVTRELVAEQKKIRTAVEALP